jgi:hypothetical protein
MARLLPFLIYLYLIINISFLVIMPDLPFQPMDIFNPIRNYKEWSQFNWFGIIVITLILNIIFLPYAIIYWIYKLFTVGRKHDE